MDWIVVATPRQLIGAAEWVAAAGRRRREVDLTVLVPSEPTAAAQLKALLADDPWPHVDVRSHNGQLSRWRLVREADARRGRVDTVVIGEYRLTLTREIVDRVGARHVVLTDDGNATVLVGRHRTLTSNGSPGLASLRVNGSSDEGRRRIHRLVGLRGRVPERVRFSTIYDVDAVQPDSVQRHRFEHLRSRFDDVPVGGAPVILGCTLVESGILSGHHHDLLVGRLVSRLGAREYWPHRREDPAKVAMLAQRFGLVIDLPATAVESAVLGRPVRPPAVGSIMSSAVDSFAVMFDDVEIALERPPAEMVNLAARDNVALVSASTERLLAEAAHRRETRTRP